MRYFGLILIAFVSSTCIHAQTIFTTSTDGEWSDELNWVSNDAPECKVQDDVFIEHQTIGDCSTMEVAGNGSITVRNGAKLTIQTPTGIKGTGDIEVEPTGVLIINGDLDIGGTGKLTSNGTTYIYGDLNFNSGASSAVGTGSIFVSGTGCGGFSGTGNCINGALPITLISFSAEHTPMGNQVLWQTASEQNNDFFTVERSVDGFNFFEIGDVKGAGNSSTAIGYEFLDKNVRNETVYYRLKQTDFDGSYSYSNIAVVALVKAKQIKMWPNVLEGDQPLTLVLPENRGSVLQVFNSTGTLMFEEILEDEQVVIGSEKLSMLSSGYHLIRIQTAGFVHSEKLLVK